MSYQVTARNFSESSENRIHSDDIAKKFGFRGALVPGVAVYGHLSYPLVANYGEAWLGHSVTDLRLLKPAYHNDPLTLTLHDGSPEDEGAEQVDCHNTAGELLAVLRNETPAQLPQPEDLASFGTDYKTPERVEIAWDTVHEGQPFIPWEVTITPDMNRTKTEQVADSLAVYETCAHPHLLCSLANTALTNEYVMPTWIHVGSQMRHRKIVRVGDTLTVRCATLEKWRKKGHEFIRLYVSFWRDGEELTTDIAHTAIFKVAA